MKQETYLRKCGTSMIAAAMILVTLLSGLPVPDALAGEVSAGGGNFAGGDGTAEYPYQIEDILDLQNMSANLNAHYVLVNDIDASATRNWNEGKGFEPVGNSSNKFTGSLGGQGYKITGLFINRASEKHVGLFGCVGTGGSISNVSMVNVSISGNSRVGGLVGYNGDTLENCSATGNVNGGTNAGGLVGRNYGMVQNCSATGNVSVGNYVGGLVGYNYDHGTVENCSATGNVSGNAEVGGLVGINWGTVENSFYCINYTTLNGNNIVTPYGIYEAQFEDWLDDRTLDINDYLHIVSATDYYNMGSISDLKACLPFASGNYKFRQTADIDLSTEPGFYIPVLDGTEYDGDGHSISGLNLTYLTNSNEGLFGKLGSDSRISNISLIDCDVSGNGNVGGLVGYNDNGTVENCYATGNVSGNNDIGGLVGYNHGTVKNSYATGNVSGNGWVGGLVGGNGGTVENCYATGDVSGNYRVGGLVGCNYGPVENCFWDIEASGTTTSAGGTGKNTTNMMKKCTFTDAGWDFDNTWNIIEGESYPYLRLSDLDGDGIPDPEDTDMDGDGVPNTSDAFPKDPTKWEEEEEKSNENESFLSQKIGPLPLYAYLVIVIIGLAAGAGALKMKGGKSGGDAQKPEQSQQFPQQQSQQQQFPRQPPQQQPTQPAAPFPGPPGQATWLCPKCGNKVDQKFIFCTECGFKRMS